MLKYFIDMMEVGYQFIDMMEVGYQFILQYNILLYLAQFIFENWKKDN